MANGTTSSSHKASSNGLLAGDNPLHFNIDLLTLQIMIILGLTRGLGALLKPLRQPRVIAEVIGGVLLGPSALGRIPGFTKNVFPKSSLEVLETIAGIGLIFFLFLVGLELDLRSIRKTGGTALAIAASGITIPFMMGIGASFALRETVADKGVDFGPFLVFMGVAMSITAFPVLARILAERKLLTTDVGQMAMSAAAVNDVVAWVLLALAVALSTQGKSGVVAVYVLLLGAAFCLAMFFLVKPVFAYLAGNTPSGEPVNETIVALIFLCVLVSGFMTDIIGIHAIFGAFIFGLTIPKDGPLPGALIEKMEDFVSTLMLPLYFASSGLKTNVGTVKSGEAVGMLFLVIGVACIGKIGGTFLVARFFAKLDARKSLTLGFLMNTKGLVELIVLNIGLAKHVINEEIFTIMVLMALVTTFMTSPMVMLLYEPARDPIPYVRKKLDMQDKNDELRLLVCVHGMKHVPAMLNITEVLRGKRKRDFRVYLLHLLEYNERSSTIMQVARARKDGQPFWSKDPLQREADSAAVAFETYGRLSKVSVRAMLEISGFNDMHEDICGTANARRTNLILLPFHKAEGFDGFLETVNPGFHQVNNGVLRYAPCSVAIIVDRGFGGANMPIFQAVTHNIAVLFYGGPDDREALMMGRRIAEHPGCTLTVFRFSPGPGGDGADGDVAVDVDLDSDDKDPEFPKKKGIPGLPHVGSSFHITEDQEEINNEVAADKAAFEALMSLDTLKEERMNPQMDKDPSDGDRAPPSIRKAIVVEERETNDPVAVAKEIASSGTYNLIVVGRGRRPPPILVDALAREAAVNHPASPAHHTDDHKLGIIGDALTAVDSRLTSSILVVQQFDPTLVPLSAKKSQFNVTSTNTPNGDHSPNTSKSNSPRRKSLSARSDG